jgi:hypothetical protein
MERLLYRIGLSEHSNSLILKGATLFFAWKAQSYRITKDADFLGIGIDNETTLINIFKKICVITSNSSDGMQFDPNTVKARQIRENHIYGGIRVTLQASLYNAKIPLQIDIGYGDIVSPMPEDIEFPTILDAEPPQLKAYTRYSVVAEKFNAMVELGSINSRLKDFYDIWLLSQLFPFEGSILRKSILDTFAKRKTQISQTIPYAFTSDFYLDVQKQKQWNAFIKKSRAEFDKKSFSEIVLSISDFISPVIDSILKEQDFLMHWVSGSGSWE